MNLLISRQGRFQKDGGGKQKTHVFSDGYLADINQPGCLEGYLILKPKGGQNEVVSEMDNLLSFRTQKPQ